MKQRNPTAVMCPADCSLPSAACPCRGLASLSVFPLADPWGRHVHVQLPLTTSDPWIDEYSGDVLNRKLRQFAEGEVDKLVEEPSLPKDPRQWSREDVAVWLQHITAAHRLPSVHLDRFLMNGKALCLMTIDMFVHRVPLGGKLLYKDFQLRLSSALYS